METRPDRYAREQEIRDRLNAIGERLDALARARAADRYRGTAADSAAQAQDAEDAAGRAGVSCRRALYWAAQAHERAADAHDKAAVTGFGDPAEHHRRAAFHRDAALADRLKAAGLIAARLPGSGGE